MSNAANDTLRVIHERCKARHFDRTLVNEQGANPFELCDACDEEWPCPDYQDAVAALKLLGECERAYTKSADSHGDYCCDCGTAIRFHANWPGSHDDVHGRFVPDPEAHA